MNFGPQRTTRTLPCKEGHTWNPVAPEPGRPGFMRYHCPVCGEQASMKPTGEESPDDAFERRIAALETTVAEQAKKIDDLIHSLNMSD